MQFCVPLLAANPCNATDCISLVVIIERNHLQLE